MKTENQNVVSEETIRTMTIQDYESVYRLWKGTAGMGLRSLDDSEAGIARFLTRNPATNFVALLNDEIVGVILSGHDGRRGYIYHAAVKETLRGNGLGRRLLAAATEALKAEGIHKAALVVFSNNAIGNGFWEKAGFSAREDLIYRNKSLSEENF